MGIFDRNSEIVIGDIIRCCDIVGSLKNISNLFDPTHIRGNTGSDIVSYLINEINKVLCKTPASGFKLIDIFDVLDAAGITKPRDFSVITWNIGMTTCIECIKGRVGLATIIFSYNSPELYGLFE